MPTTPNVSSSSRRQSRRAAHPVAEQVPAPPATSPSPCSTTTQRRPADASTACTCGTSATSPTSPRSGATGLLIAMPSADASLLSGLDRAGRAAGLKVYTLPTVAQLVDGNVSSNQIRRSTRPTSSAGTPSKST